MRIPPPDFDIGDHVTIKPMEDCPARVIAMELDRDGWTVVVRYFQNGDAKTLKAFPDEIELSANHRRSGEGTGEFVARLAAAPAPPLDAASVPAPDMYFDRRTGQWFKREGDEWVEMPLIDVEIERANDGHPQGE